MQVKDSGSEQGCEANWVSSFVMEFWRYGGEYMHKIKFNSEGVKPSVKLHSFRMAFQAV